jgi:hypothetical protein
LLQMVAFNFLPSEAKEKIKNSLSFDGTCCEGLYRSICFGKF